MSCRTIDFCRLYTCDTPFIVANRDEFRARMYPGIRSPGCMLVAMSDRRFASWKVRCGQRWFGLGTTLATIRWRLASLDSPCHASK
jgi:hypothetical protein